ncbi:glycosyltransferase [bacterium]|nr:glycosyltransferase [bacterium]
MKILHVIDTLDFVRGGPPQVCSNVITEQAKNHEIGLVSYSSEETNRASIAEVNFENFTVSSFDIGEALFGSRSALKFKEITTDYDVVHLHNAWEPLLLSGANYANEHSIPYAITLHGMLDEWPMRQKTLKKRLALLLGRRNLIAGAKFVQALSKNEEEGIRKLGFTNRCEVIPNGISLEVADQSLCKDEFNDAYPQLAEKPFVLFLGRLHYVKGLDILAKAALSFFEQFPDWRLVVAGPDAGMKNAFEEAIESSGIESKVHLLGPIYGSMKYSLLASCQIFCAPSRQEAFSVSIVEAMAAGKPVAITTECHFEKIRTSRSGLVVDFDADLLSRSFCELAGSKELRLEMGKNGRRLVEQTYNWKAISQQLTHCYAN